MKSEYQWSKEVRIAFRKWKESDIRSYDKFRKWTKRQLMKQCGIAHMENQRYIDGFGIGGVSHGFRNLGNGNRMRVRIVERENDDEM